jgi:hypothetical protein
MKLETVAKQVINESSLSRIHNKIESGIIGFISGERNCKTYREDGECEVYYTKMEKQQRARSLAAKLLNAEYSVTAIKGSYVEDYGLANEKEVSERSFMVAPRKPEQVNTFEKNLLALGEEFEQDSILIVENGQARLIGTSKRDGSWPSYHEAVPQGKFHGGERSQYMSRLGNRPITFREAYELPYPVERMAKYGVYAISKQRWQDIQIKDNEFASDYLTWIT